MFATNGAATVAAGGLDLYTQADGVPGWADSLLLATLTRGAVYRLTLSADHGRVIDPPAMEFKTTNRYRDLAIRPDGRAFYVATDNETQGNRPGSWRIRARFSSSVTTDIR